MSLERFSFFFNYVSLNFLLLSLPGCLNQSKNVKQASGKKKYKQQCDALEAKHSDIPIPLGSTPTTSYEYEVTSPNNVVLAYHYSMKVNDVVTFYKQEMERFGWRYVISFEGKEQLLHFEKPHKVAIVSIRPKKIVIFTGSKTA